MVIFLLIFLFISFLFMPIKITLYFSNKDYFIRLYRFNLLSKEGGLLKKFITKSKTKKNYKKKSKKTNTKKKPFLKISFKRLYGKLKNNVYKPKLNLCVNLNFSLADAATTAIFYGLLCNLNYIIYKILSIIFNLSGFNFNPNPEFKDSLLLEFTISSIISCNLAQIIYMLFLIFKCKEKIEEVAP